jgi:hypothetical protein
MAQEGQTASVEHLRADVEDAFFSLEFKFGGGSTSKQHSGGHQGPNACKDMSMDNVRSLFVTRFLSSFLFIYFEELLRLIGDR